MRQYRNVPFGYKIEKSKIILEKDEANAVQRIFLSYLSGDTLQNIATQMENAEVRYHKEVPTWNKNMIKRILENERYTGIDEYPEIISEADYLAVRQMNQEKQSRRPPRPDSLKTFRKLIRCSKCGSNMLRHPNTNRVYWTCTNENCKESVRIADEALCLGVNRTLALLAQSPALLDSCAPDKQQVTPDVLRLQNELTAAFNRGTESPEYMRSLIFSLAAEQYNALPDMSLIHTLRELKEKIAAEGITEDNRREIDQKAVRRILLSRESGVSIELINGKIISSKEEAEQ